MLLFKGKILFMCAGEITEILIDFIASLTLGYVTKRSSHILCCIDIEKYFAIYSYVLLQVIIDNNRVVFLNYN